MKQKVQCGVLTSILKTLGLLSSEFAKGINSLWKLGIEAKNAEEKDTPNGKQYIITFDVPSADVKNMIVVFDPKGDSLYDVSYEYLPEGGSKLSDDDKDVKLVSDKDVSKYIQNLVEGLFGDANVQNYSEEIKESSKIQLKLQKVQASTGYEIHMTGIVCGTDVGRVESIIDTLMNDSEFAESVPETEQVYEVEESENAIEVNPVSSMIADNPFVTLLKAAKALKEDLQYIHWNAKGENFQDLHSYTDSTIWSLNGNIDTFAEWSVEYFNEVPHPSTLDYETSLLFTDSGFTADQGFAILRQRLNDYISLIELVYCNFDSDVQSILDEIVRGYKKDANYLIARRLLK